MATYYKKIKGKNYDKKLMNAADSSVKGKGDGRISLNDAKKILPMVKDSSDYTDVEKNTMKYIRDHYDFTPEADRWFRTEVRKWAATRGATVKKPAKPVRPAKKPAKAAPSALQREKVNMKPPIPVSPKNVEEQKPETEPGLLRKIIQFILILLIIAVMVLLIIPSTRDSIKNRISLMLGSSVQQKIQEIKTPPSEQQTAPEQKAPAVEQQGTPAQQAKAPEKPEQSGDYYTVQVKDDLISISEKVLGNYSRWVDLFNANRDIIKNPTMIFPGQKLKIPPAKK